MRTRPMKSPVLLSIALTATLGAGCQLAPEYSASPLPNEPRGPLAILSWLEGAWIDPEGGARTVEEHWIVPRGGLMLGVNRSIRDGQAIAFEFLRIEKRDDESIVYVAQPNGRSPGTDFPLVEHSENRAVFRNPDHDFPDTLIYERVGDDLTIRVEGQSGAGRGGFTLQLRRDGSTPLR